mmetsp:Transcript_15318/g.28840  ORF Transcript_15318/g.28840 Transcript_15318/m.28840 type:complete len:721 (-) Transcript_15318:47-2209(-)
MNQVYIAIKLLLFTIASHVIQMSLAEDPWSFIVIADPHIAETFASKNETHPWYQLSFQKHLSTVKRIKEFFGGELVLIPGDTNGGKWDTRSFARDKLGNASLTPEEAVLIASHGCYGTLRKIFAEGGYHQILVALGDHELGGNGWNPGSSKHSALHAYREGFQLELNRNENGDFLYNQPIENAPSRPFGTPHENTSYALQYKNVLFVTIDCFHDKGYVFQDRSNGLGGEGSVTNTVEGKHLEWFERVLKQARDMESIKHIVVQAHIPIFQPVRKVGSSGQFFDMGEKSEFWKVMETYNVDIYLAGEVHATTVSKRTSSNLLQVVSRGNQFNNFLGFSVTDDSIQIKAFNEIATHHQNVNKTYTEFGELTVVKTDAETKIEATGILELLSIDKALIRYDFERTFALNSRQVIGMGDKHNLLHTQKMIRGVSSKQSMRNKGSLGQQYDAQVANIEFVPGRRGERAGRFTELSRFSVFARGPHGAGNLVSYNIWIKTAEKNSEMIIVHYGHVWGDLVNGRSSKDFHTLTLDNGNPTLYIDADSKLIPVKSRQLNDNKWHHISVSMSRKSCLLSEVLMYVDGNKIDTFVPNNDKHIFHITSGSMSLAGFGYTSNFEELFPHMKPFVGVLDEFLMFGVPVVDQLRWMTAPSYIVRYGTNCVSNNRLSTTITTNRRKCERRCNRKSWCKGYQFSNLNGQNQCTHFENPEYGENVSNTRCAILREVL